QMRSLLLMGSRTSAKGVNVYSLLSTTEPLMTTEVTAVTGVRLSGSTLLGKRSTCAWLVCTVVSRSPRRRLATSALAGVALLMSPPPLKVKTATVLVGIQLVRLHPRDANLSMLHGVRQRHEGRDAVRMQPLA